MQDVIKKIEQAQAAFELANTACNKLTLDDEPTATSYSRWELSHIKASMTLQRNLFESLLLIIDGHMKTRSDEMEKYLTRRGLPPLSAQHALQPGPAKQPVTAAGPPTMGVA